MPTHFEQILLLWHLRAAFLALIDLPLSSELRTRIDFVSVVPLMVPLMVPLTVPLDIRFTSDAREWTFKVVLAAGLRGDMNLLRILLLGIRVCMMYRYSMINDRESFVVTSVARRGTGRGFQPKE